MAVEPTTQFRVPIPGDSLGDSPGDPGAAVAQSRGLLDALVALGRLDEDAARRALRLQSESNDRFDVVLLQLGYVGERDLADAYASLHSLDVVDAAQYRSLPDFNGRLSAEFLERARLIPIEDDDDGVVVAMADPGDEFAVQAVRLALGKPVERRVGLASEIDVARRRWYVDGSSDDLSQIEALDGDSASEQGDIEHLRDMASEAPVIRMVNHIIAEALSARASDIHFEPFENSLQIRFRLDGVLQTVPVPSGQSVAAILSRLKVLANLDIAERRLPQDGRMKLRIEGREIDFRISTLPTMYGESIVLRILDKGTVPLDFASLGFDARAIEALEAIFSRPNGVVLVTGPTGSGKTTTLYTALTKLNTPERKILTVEDPVEYQLEGVNQLQIRPQIGLGFAEALRSILRQDPDVIMIGEMRDLETARIAVQAALTGHQVFSTLHTNDAASSITRLLDMGLDDFLLTSTVNAVIAQRLVRRLCPSCRVATAPPSSLEPRFAELVSRGLLDNPGGASVVYRACGCERCDDRGYLGRTTVHELIVMSEPIRRAVLEQGDATAIRAAAQREGFISMYDDGLLKVHRGETTLEEVLRVTQDV